MDYVPFIYSCNGEPTYAALGVRTPHTVYPALTGGLRARPSVNMSQKIGETSLRRCSVPRIPPRLCAASRHFGNHGHDCLGPRLSHSAISNCCLGKCQARHYGTHIVHLGVSAPIKCHHVSAGGTAAPLQSHQVQISSKLCGGKDIGPTCGFTTSPEWARGPLSVPYRSGIPTHKS
jgi:hypothetical protein